MYYLRLSGSHHPTRSHGVKFSLHPLISGGACANYDHVTHAPKDCTVGKDMYYLRLSGSHHPTRSHGVKFSLHPLISGGACTNYDHVTHAPKDCTVNGCTVV